MIHKAIAIIAMGLSLAACNATVKDFVNGVAPPSINTATPGISSNSANGIKMSPGRFEADNSADTDCSGSGFCGSIRANVTQTNHKMTSANVSAIVSISRIRVDTKR